MNKGIAEHTARFDIAALRTFGRSAPPPEGVITPLLLKAAHSLAAQGSRRHGEDAGGATQATCKGEEMNKEDIIRMARVAGCHDNGEEFRFVELHYLERFAALVAAAERDKYEAKFKQLEAIMQEREQQPNKPCCLAEREACAKVCDVTPPYPFRPSIEAAHAIRARGKE